MESVLLISPESWGQNYVSKHHFAVELANKGIKVYFLNSPTSRFSINEVMDNLFVIDYEIKFRGLRWFPDFLSAVLIKKEVKNLEKLTETNFDVIWNFDSSRFVLYPSTIKDKIVP